MGNKKRKGRSVRNNHQVLTEADEIIQAPHSFIIHRGLPGGNIIELTKDFRKVMEPFTAASLKERKKNAIKDFVSISGALHISHMCIFTRTELGMYLKIGKMARGPTLTFKIHNFTLARDVISSLKKQFAHMEIFKHSPLVILNSFSGEGMQMKLMASTFQNMFPTINLTNISLNTIRRCVLLNYNSTSKLIDFRHYAIKVIPVGISKGVKKVVQGKVPNLAKCNDIADFLTKTAVLSDSEFEDDPSNHVTLPQKISSRGNMENSQSAIRLSELGPRLSLQLIKVEDGLLDGEVLFHELVHKTEEEKEEITKKREAKRKLKEKRKKIQDMNAKKKDDKKGELKQKSLDGMKKKTETDILMRKAAREANNETRTEDDDDAEYYRQEVGEEPDRELFSSMKKRTQPYNDFKNKRMKTDDNKEGFKKKFDTDSKFKKGGFGDRDSTFKKGGFGDRDSKFKKGGFGDRDSKFKKGEFGDKDSKFKKGGFGDRDSKFKKGGFGDRDSKFKGGKFGRDKFDKDKKFTKRGDKFDKFNKKGRDGDKKWPGGRGGNPKYGFKPEEGEGSNSFSDRKPKRVMGSKIQKGKHNKRR